MRSLVFLCVAFALRLAYVAAPVWLQSLQIWLDEILFITIDIP